MNKRAPWVKWYAEDFLAGIIGLEAEEIGVYIVVLNLIYDKGGPIPNNPVQLGRRMAMRPTTVVKLLAALEEYGKLVLADGLISNPRAEKELETRSKVIEKLKKNFSGGEVNKTKNINKNKHTSPTFGDANGPPEAVIELELDSRKKERKKDSRPVKKQDTDVYSEEFEALWKLYPRTRNTSKKKAHDLWRVLSAENQEKVRRAVPIFAAAMRAEGRPEDKIKHFQFWLSERVYETVAAAPGSPAAQAGEVDRYKTASREDWAKIALFWRINYNWKESWGPAPGKPGCMFPEDLLSDLEKHQISLVREPRKKGPAAA